MPMRKKIATIIFFAVCCAAFSVQASAKEFESRQSGLDVMFAIDSSGSMVSNDPGRMGMSMVKAFSTVLLTPFIPTLYAMSSMSRR